MDKPLQRGQVQRGFSLLEILAALALGVLMMTSLTAMVDISLKDTKGQQAAQYQDQFTSAASRYLNDNSATLLAQTAGNVTVAVPLATLKTALYLPPSFATANAYRQTPCILVRSPAAGQLDALVVTEGGDEILVNDIGYVAANAGTGGGSIGYLNATVTTDPIVARGAYDTWRLDSAALANFTRANCSGTAAGLGHMASSVFYGGPNTANRDVLFRNPTPADPTLNQMNTPLGMGAGATVVAGSGCGATAAIAMDANRNIVTCSTSGVWSGSSSWKAPVANFAALSAIAAPTDGDVHMTVDTGRAFMFNAAATPQWVALAVDQNNNLNVPGKLAAGDTINAGTTITAGTDINSGRTIFAANNITAAFNMTAGQDLTVLRDATVQNNITSNVGAVKAPVVFATAYSESPSYGVSFVAAGGDACNFFRLVGSTNQLVYPIGTLIKDTNGITLMCRVTASGPIFVYANGSTTPPP